MVTSVFKFHISSSSSSSYFDSIVMAIEVVPLTGADIPGAIEVIQQAFADDPYFKWVFDSSKVSLPSRRPNQVVSPTGNLPSCKKQES